MRDLRRGNVFLDSLMCITTEIVQDMDIHRESYMHVMKMAQVTSKSSDTRIS